MMVMLEEEEYVEKLPRLFMSVKLSWSAEAVLT